MFFKKENKTNKFKIFVIILYGMFALGSLLNISLIANYIETLTGDVIAVNFGMYTIFLLLAIYFMYFANLSNYFDDKYPASKKVFNLLITLLCFAFMTNGFYYIMYYIIYNELLYSQILYLLFGIVPVIVYSNYKVNKKDYFISKNKNDNFTNFVILYLLIECYINAVSSLINLLSRYEVADSLESLIFSLLFMCIIKLSSKMINKKAK